MNISRVLPMVKDLDGFMGNLTSVTSALQIAFDSTLLALFLSAALMLVQTLVYRRSEDLLARVDRWVVENVLPRFGAEGTDRGRARRGDRAAPRAIRRELAAVHRAGRAVVRAAGDPARREPRGPDRAVRDAVDRLPTALAGFQRGADAIGRIGSDLDARRGGRDAPRGVATLGRIEAVVATERAAVRAARRDQEGASTAPARRSKRCRARWASPTSDRAGPPRSSSPGP